MNTKITLRLDQETCERVEMLRKASACRVSFSQIVGASLLYAESCENVVEPATLTGSEKFAGLLTACCRPGTRTAEALLALLACGKTPCFVCITSSGAAATTVRIPRGSAMGYLPPNIITFNPLKELTVHLDVDYATEIRFVTLRGDKEVKDWKANDISHYGCQIALKEMVSYDNCRPDKDISEQ